jgi:hypothetical protein
VAASATVETGAVTAVASLLTGAVTADVDAGASVAFATGFETASAVCAGVPARDGDAEVA